MKYLINYDKCVFCGSSKLKKRKDQSIPRNFYLKAIQSDLNLSEVNLRKIKVFECLNCHIVQNNPWFTKDVSRKIYSNIYGQHNRSWQNLINFLTKGKLPNHGNLFNILNKKIDIKNYAEFNSPFMGLFLNFFSNEYSFKNKFYINIFKNIISYLNSRQVVGKSIKFRNYSFKKSKFYIKKIKNLKEENLIKKKINKYLLIDNSSLCWGQNDNFKSVNSRSFASEMLDLKICDLGEINKDFKYDLFGIFHTLDHTFNPNKVLKYALKNSKYVIVYCHINPSIEKQHLFSITREFLNYLKKQNIYTLDLSNIINKEYTVPEMYFLCSEKKSHITKIKKSFKDL